MEKMEKSKVYFTDFRTVNGVGLPEKLKKLCRKAGLQTMDMDNKFVAIKIHFGELGNIAYLRPNYAKAVADLVKEDNVVTLQDSLQQLAKMSETERLAVINKLIEDLKKAEVAELKKQQEKNIKRIN